MTQQVTLNLNQFSHDALGRFAGRGNGSPSRAVRMASMYYLSQRESQRPAWGVPRFAPAANQDYALNIELDDATWKSLSDEAEAQGVSTEVLTMHAVLYFLADLDSGRLVGLLEDALESPDD